MEELFTKEELGHAAAVETSLNLLLNEEAVKMEAAVDETPKGLPTDGLAYYPELTHERTHSGVYGVSTTASREKGRRVFELAIDALVKLIEEVRRI